MQAKNYTKKGSRFLKTLKDDVDGMIERIDQDLADLEDFKEKFTELAIRKCKQSFRNGIEAGKYSSKKGK